MLSKIATKAGYALLFTLLSLIGKAQVTSDFSSTPTSGCVPLVVSFTDKSTGSPDEWKWDLGNGTISYLKNPSVAYLTPGSYTVKLVVRNASNDEDSVTKTSYINVYAKPTVQFSSSVTTGCFPLDVNFKDESVPGNGTIESWFWDFGDGLSSTEKNPSHTYTASGNFNVTLQVKSTAGCVSTLSKTSFIQLSSGTIADFTNPVHTSCGAPVTINFQNLSTGTGTLNYKWDFGDGTGSTATNPSHTYTSKGTYTVQLILSNNNGCTDTIIKQNAITVGSVFASFKSSDSVCENSSINFNNTSAPTPSSVTWYFGDGTTSANFNPAKTYTSSGIYTVKLVSNFGACIDSATKKITVLAGPKVSFIADDTANCKIPFTVHFTNQTTNAVSYKWVWGDGKSDIASDTSHTYNAIGNFSVTLFATSKDGCNASLKKDSFINIAKTKIVLNHLPDSSCSPFTKSFSSTITSIDPVTSYLWNLGDGTTSSNPTPTNNYTTPGTYDITLTVGTASGCTDSLKIMKAVIATSKPVVDFSASPQNTCAKTEIQFSDLTTGGATKWLWRFGDKTTSTLQNPKHIYIDTGYFDVQLIVWNRGCQDSIKYTKYIHINPPIAKFAVKIDCNKPYERVFTDQSVGADEWYWDFGDGSTSNLKSPTYTYASAGTYSVSLRVVNLSSGCDFTTTKTLDVIDEKAAFTASDTAVCKGTKIDFTTGLSKTFIKTFNWNFGDGSSSVNSPNNTNTMSYTYTKTGIFNVRLTITNTLGCQSTLTKTAYIKVNGPTAKFSTPSNGSCLNSIVIFNDSSITDGVNPITGWTWNYGDGNTETLSNGPFQHNYVSTGVYTVKLKVEDSQGCSDSVTIKKPLTISKPKADFSSKDTVTCPTKTVNFTSSSTGPGLTYKWYFGDGITSTSQNPAHIYSADGAYTIKLVVIDQYGCTDSISKPNYINIVSSIPNFTISDSFSTCPPLSVQFTDLTNNSINTNWDFGDSTSSTAANPTHFYSYPGTYIAKLTVSSKGGCIKEAQKSIIIQGPTGSFSYKPVNGCLPLKVDFRAKANSNVISYIWDFNDGNTMSTTDSIVSHTYLNPGRYIPKIILVNSGGCQVPVRGKDTIYASNVTANFNFINKPLCDSGFISFIDSSYSSNNNITGYKWNFGDGNISLTKNPIYQYKDTGLYYPSLIATTSIGCVDTFTTSTPVKVVASPKIKMSTTANGCTPLTVNFSGVISVPDTSALTWHWVFGNGNTSSLQNPVSQVYTTAGVYNIDLVATNSSGCIDTASKVIEAYIIPTVDAGKDVNLCEGSSLTLNATGADTYSWSPSTGLNCTNCASPSTSAGSSITYTVVGTTVHGCSATDSVKVAVKYPFTLKYSKPAAICKGDSKKLSASGASTYEWTPSKGLDNPVSATPTAQPDTTTNYQIVGTDDLGCFKDTGTVLITVNPVPTVEAGTDKTINVGSPVDLVPTISPDVVDVTWSPTNGQFRNIYPGVTVKPTENTEYTVEVENNKGCRARDKVTVFVICNNGNVFIPNTFSPNGDGVNDIFYPRGTGLFKIKSFRIFNRWGEQVFEKTSFDANDPSSGWDGTFKGKKLNADVFVYTIDIICSNNSILTFRGNIALIE